MRNAIIVLYVVAAILIVLNIIQFVQIRKLNNKNGTAKTPNTTTDEPSPNRTVTGGEVIDKLQNGMTQKREITITL